MSGRRAGEALPAAYGEEGTRTFGGRRRGRADSGGGAGVQAGGRKRRQGRARNRPAVRSLARRECAAIYNVVVTACWRRPRTAPSGSHVGSNHAVDERSFVTSESNRTSRSATRAVPATAAKTSSAKSVTAKTTAAKKPAAGRRGQESAMPTKSAASKKAPAKAAPAAKKAPAKRPPAGRRPRPRQRSPPRRRSRPGRKKAGAAPREASHAPRRSPAAPAKKAAAAANEGRAGDGRGTTVKVNGSERGPGRCPGRAAEDVPACRWHRPRSRGRPGGRRDRAGRRRAG